MSTGESTAEYAHIWYTPSPDELAAIEGTRVWVCPYCGARGSTAREVRNHISESDGAHVGIAGTSPTRDIVAFTPDGEVASVIEGQYGDRTDGLSRERGHKKREVLNLWLVGFPDVTVSEAVELTDASENYVRELFGRLTDDDMDASEVRAFRDAQTQERLAAELEALRAGEYPSPTYAEVGERVIGGSASGDESEAAPALRAESPHEVAQAMSTMDTAAVEETLDEYTGKQVLYNLYAIEPTIHYTDAAELVGVSEEHARRNLKALAEGAVTAEALGEQLDVELQRALYSRMEERGFTAETDDDAGEYRPSIKTEVGQIPGFEEGAGAQGPEPPSFGLEKQAVVANAMRAEPSLGHREVAIVADCSAEYARTVMHKIETQAISPRRVQEMLDEDVQARIAEFVEEAGFLDEDADSETDGASTPESASPTDATGSAEATAATDSTNGDGESAQDPAPGDFVDFQTVTVTAAEAKLPILAARDRVREEPLKRVRVINAWLAPGERSYADAGRMAGSSNEHARRTYRQIERGDITPAAIRDAVDPDLINALLTLEAAHVHGQIDLGSHDLEFEELSPEAVPEGSVTYVETDAVASRLAGVEAASAGTTGQEPAPGVGDLAGGDRSGADDSSADGQDSAGPKEYLAELPSGGSPEKVVPAGKVRELLEMIETLQEFSAADPNENEQRDWVLNRLSGELESLLADAALDVDELEQD